VKNLFFFILLISFSLWFPSSYRRWTHGFKPSKCLISWPFTPEWEIQSPPPITKEELYACLEKPFSYFSKGAQSFVFLSQDEKYVLKLFRYDCCKLRFGQQWVEKARRYFGLKTKEFFSTSYKIKKNFNACQLAYTKAQEETGVVFIHLNPKKTDIPMLHLKDRLGRVHNIDPEKYRFILQKKASPFLKNFYLHTSNLQPLIDSYQTLLKKLAAKGLVNLDTTMGKNFGFLGDTAILIDVGNLSERPDQVEENRLHFENQLTTWLHKRIYLTPAS
jgi:hypothetical protein